MIKAIFSLLMLGAYGYFFILSLWGKPLYGEIGNVEYLVIFHFLAVINFFTIDSMVKPFGLKFLDQKNEFIFMIHGALISLYPYNNYQLFGGIIMASAIITFGIKNRNFLN